MRHTLRSSLLLALCLLPVACRADEPYPVARGISVKPGTIPDAADLQRIKSWGCNMVRLTMSVDPLLDPAPPFAINEKNLRLLLDRAFAARDAGLRVVIDPHAYPGLARPFTMMPNDKFWTDAVYGENVIRLWQRLAAEFKDQGPWVEYDLMNEPIAFEDAKPGSPRDYFGLVQRIIDAVRAIDQTHYIHFEVPALLRADGKVVGERLTVVDRMPAFKGGRLVLHVHMYAPLDLTHYGISERNQMTEYPGRDRNGTLWNADKMRAIFAPLAAYQQRHHVPVFIGEIGCARWLGDDALRWFHDALEIFREHGWSWIYHTYKSGETAWDPELGPDQANRVRSENTVQMRLLQAYWQDRPDDIPAIPPPPKSPQKKKPIAPAKLKDPAMVQ